MRLKELLKYNQVGTGKAQRELAKFIHHCVDKQITAMQVKGGEELY